MTRSEASLRWLHLSDLHIKAPDPHQATDWSQDVVLASLMDDICERYRTSSLDLIFITGDISYSGQPAQYAIGKDFIMRLAAALKVPTERVFLVPGNHDIDRSLEEDAFAGARRTLATPREVDKFFGNEGRRRTVFQRQRAYRQFASHFGVPDHGGYSDTSFAHSKKVQVGPVTVHILLIDSSWLAEGDTGDHGRLLVGEPQIYQLYRTLQTEGLTIGLMHHPFSWLCEFEERAIENLLLSRIHLLLRGHVHTSDIASLEAKAQRLIVFTAGAGFETRTSNNSYAVCLLDLHTGKGQITTHRYTHHTKRWNPLTPESWVLLTPPTQGVALEDALALFLKANAKFPYYGAALVSGIQGEVPLVVGSSVVYVSHDAQIPAQDQRPGALIATLRHLITWRHIWRLDAWETALLQSIQDFDGLLDQYADSDANARLSLGERESNCNTLAHALRHQRPSSDRPTINHLRMLVRQSDWDSILAVTTRWQDAGVLTDDEKREARRARVQAYTGAGDSDEALSELQLLVHNDCELSDLELAAAVYFKLKMYAPARDFIYRALDGGTDLSAVRNLALAIAGACGDAELAERTRPRPK